MKKQCVNCNNFKLLEEFFRDSGLADGRANTCKVCKQQKTYAWRERNKEKYNAYMRQKNKERYPNDRLKRYGTTKEWYDKTLSEQGGLCAICSKPNTSKKRTLAVDHHHVSGKVRGILCYNCNRLLHAFDNLDLYNKIMEYLSKHRSKST